MKKLLLGLVLLTGSQLHSAAALGEPPAKRVRIEEKPVTLRLSDGITEIKLSSSLAKAFTLLKNILEDLGESDDEVIPVNNQFVTQETLDQFEAFDSESIVTFEHVLGIINQYSLEQLVRLFLANNFLEFSKEFTMEDETTKQLADILFEKIIKVLITTEDVNGVESVLALLEQLPNIAKYFKAELYKRKSWVLLRTLQEHTRDVTSVAFSPNGQLIVTGSMDRTAKVWDVQTGQLLHTLQGHTDPVTDVAFSPNSQLIATVSYDKTVKLWDPQTGRCLHTLQEHARDVTSVIFSPNGQLIVTGSYDQTAKIWNTQTGRCLHTLQEHGLPVTSVAFSPNGQLIATASNDRTAKLWDPQTGRYLHTLQDDCFPISLVAFSPDGSMIATVSADKTAKVWDVQRGQLFGELEGHTGTITSVAFSPDGSTLVTGSADRRAKVWDVQTGQILHTLQGHTAFIISVAFSPDGSMIATGSWDSTTKIWDPQTGQSLHTLQGHTNRVSSIAFSPDGQLIATGSDDTTTKIWINNFAKAGITSLEQALQLSILDVLHVFKTGEMPVKKIPAAESKAELLTSDSFQGVEQTQVAGPAETRPEEPPAKRRKKSHNPFDVRHAHPGRSQVDSEDSLSDEGEDEEFFCKFCNQEFNNQKALKKHENQCDKRAPAYNEDDWL